MVQDAGKTELGDKRKKKKKPKRRHSPSESSAWEVLRSAVPAALKQKDREQAVIRVDPRDIHVIKITTWRTFRSETCRVIVTPGALL